MSSEINWKKGDILETPKGEQFMFGHYDGWGGFWVHRITKSGKMDRGSQGGKIGKEGVVPAVLDLAKRGGWPKRKTKTKSTFLQVAREDRAKKKQADREDRAKPVKRYHRWSGAGYICADCGGIKDTSVLSDNCPGLGRKPGFDVWLYHAGAGWWLEESEIDNHSNAAGILKRKIGTGNVVAGAILPAGNPLGLFFKRYGQ